MLRIAHLTSVHVPTDTRILYKECATLAGAGHDVTLVAATDEPWDHDAVRLVRVPRARSKGRRMVDTTRAVYRGARGIDADVYHLHDPELLPVGVALRRGRHRVVYDVHEDNAAEILAKDWISPWLRRPVAAATRLVERAAVTRLDLVVAATPPIAGLFPAGKTVTVQNFPLLDELAPASPTRHADREPVVAFVGDLTVIRGALDMVRAMEFVPEGLRARLALAGRCSPPPLEAVIDATPGRASTDLLGWQDRAQVRDLLGRSRLGLVVLHPTPNHLAAQPNKLFEYMSAGLPVVASDFPRYREIVDGAKCGLLVDPRDPAAIGSAITWLLERPEEAEAMGRRGRAAVEQDYSWDREAEVLLAAYERLAASLAAG